MNKNEQLPKCCLVLAFCGFCLLSGSLLSVASLVYDAVFVKQMMDWVAAMFYTGSLFFIFATAFYAILNVFYPKGADNTTFREWIKRDEFSVKSFPEMIKCLFCFMGSFSLLSFVLATAASVVLFFIEILFEDYAWGVRLLALGAGAAILAVLCESTKKTN